MRFLSLKIKNFKCFGDQEQGFDDVKPVNLIIGKNNSGKSALIDLVRYSVHPFPLAPYSRKGRTPEVFTTLHLSSNEIEQSFSVSRSGGEIPSNHQVYGMRWNGKPISFRIAGENTLEFKNIDPPFDVSGPNLNEYIKNLQKNVKIPFWGKQFKRLSSERDISMEGAAGALRVNEHGSGATNVIRGVINLTKFDRDIVEVELLNALNEIFKPQIFFEQITVQEDEHNNWEIYLSEKKKGHIALSSSGSGLKTVILVLLNLLVLPKLENIRLENYVFAFEELENNLHPSLQRNLFRFIRDFVVKEKACVFITSHSNVVIDLFSNDDAAKIVHIQNDGEISSTKTVQTHLDRSGILNDLDYRASDLLQSNAIVWVEGPSDRIYFNKFIELWAGGELREGVHYQCVFYGGRLLSHLNATDSLVSEAVSIIKVNRNAVILIDSDKTSRGDEINDTKKRVISEVEGAGGIAWVTAGKEIENYLPAISVRNYLNLPVVAEVKSLKKFSDYLERIDRGRGKWFVANKVEFARDVSRHLSKASLATRLDLNEKMEKICETLKRWNNLI